ncbi:MAG: hypothetical protein LUD18_13165 [Lachnospiraceae bacterium]|nr:hypothetical protein [Lachnospiraceae bacterium]
MPGHADSALTAQAASANVPSLNARITQNNILKLLNTYDTDGAYLLKNRIAAGDDILTWFAGCSDILSGIDTAVHEETHLYSYAAEKNGKAAYYVGNQKTIYVPYTEVFPSIEMASSIPSSMRTFRYSAYIADADDDLASNVDGIYGLLNEFMAYRSGMSTILSLYDYLIDQDADWDTWMLFINECENDMQAYAEFKYYILHYLYYAKQNYPDIYRAIIQNTQFCKAYKKLESSYAKLIRQYQKDLKKLQKYYAKKGYTLTIKNSTISLTTPQKRTICMCRCYSTYLKLEKKLNKTRYTNLHNKLLAGVS